MKGNSIHLNHLNLQPSLWLIQHLDMCVCLFFNVDVWWLKKKTFYLFCIYFWVFSRINAFLDFPLYPHRAYSLANSSSPPYIPLHRGLTQICRRNGIKPIFVKHQWLYVSSLALPPESGLTFYPKYTHLILIFCCPFYLTWNVFIRLQRRRFTCFDNILDLDN